jgi:hypothetical protein
MKSLLAWALGLWLVAASVAFAQPDALERIEGGPLVIFYELPFERTARELARRAPAEMERISEALGLPLPEQAEVHLLPRKGGGDPRSHGLPSGPDWSAGLTLGSRPVIVLRTAEDSGSGTRVSQVFAHELVHLIAGQALEGRHSALPAWLKEGTAAHLAFEWRITDSGRALRFAVGRSFVPLSRLRHGFTGDSQAIGDAYFQSRAFVSWLVDEKGVVKFRELWRRLDEGQDFNRAFFRTYDTRVSDLERDWQRHFMRRYAWVPLLTSATTPWLAVMALVFVGWARKRQRGKAKLAAWEEEERLLAAAELDDHDDGVADDEP